MVPGQMKRYFRIHLSTAMVLLLIAALILWANLRISESIPAPIEGKYEIQLNDLIDKTKDELNETSQKLEEYEKRHKQYGVEDPSFEFILF